MASKPHKSCLWNSSTNHKTIRCISSPEMNLKYVYGGGSMDSYRIDMVSRYPLEVDTTTTDILPTSKINWYIPFYQYSDT